MFSRKHDTLVYSSLTLLNCHGTSRENLFYLCKLPFFVAQGASASCLEPALNAIKMKDMPTVTPRNAQARMIRISSGVSLVLNTGLIQVIATDGTCVCADGPRPHSYCIPLLDFKTLAKFVFALQKVNQNCSLLASKALHTRRATIRALTFCLSLFSCCTSTSMASASSAMAVTAPCEPSSYRQSTRIRNHVFACSTND